MRKLFLHDAGSKQSPQNEKIRPFELVNGIRMEDRDPAEWHHSVATASVNYVRAFYKKSTIPNEVKSDDVTDNGAWVTTYGTPTLIATPVIL